MKSIKDINPHLRAVLHEDEHLLPVDLHPEVVDQVWVVDRLENPQFIRDIPGEYRKYQYLLHHNRSFHYRVFYQVVDSQLIHNIPDDHSGPETFLQILLLVMILIRHLT